MTAATNGSNRGNDNIKPEAMPPGREMKRLSNAVEMRVVRETTRTTTQAESTSTARIVGEALITRVVGFPLCDRHP